MSKEAVFTMKLEPELRDAFVAEAPDEDRPASQVMRELMRDCIEKKRQSRDYDDYLRRKVEAGRADRVAGRSCSDREVEAESATARDELLSRVRG